MKTNIIFTLMTGVFLVTGMILNTSAKAQEWSAAQKEVWKVETDMWTAMTKGDAAAFLEYFHPDYMGWDDNNTLPSTKPEVQKWFQLYAQGRKVLDYSIKPVGIRIFGDVAILDYYYSMANEVDGKKKMEEGRWTDILMKQGTRWLLIGDNGGEAVKKHED
jgi:ketosteroid isomerase-like protein